MEGTVLENVGTKRGVAMKVTRLLAIPAMVGALALGVVANGVFAQEQGGTTANAPTTAGIFAGTCDVLGASALALNDIGVSDDDGRRPSGDPVGAAEAAEVLMSNTEPRDANLDDLLAQPHSIVVNGADGTAVACGEVGGSLYDNEDLYVGLRAQNGSGVAGVALIEGDDDDPELEVTLFLVTDATGGVAATPAS